MRKSKRLKFKLSKVVLILVVLSFFITISFIACRFQLKALLPLDLRYLNPHRFSMIPLMITSGLIALYFLLIKLKEWLKIVGILLSWIIVFFVSIWVGHGLTDKFAYIYLNRNTDSFNELIYKAEKLNVKKISCNLPYGEIKIIDIENNVINDNDLLNKTKELGFRVYKREGNVRISYEFSRWGGYGFYFKVNEYRFEKRTNNREKIKSLVRMSDSVYFYTTVD